MLLSFSVWVDVDIARDGWIASMACSGRGTTVRGDRRSGTFDKGVIAGQCGEWQQRPMDVW